MNRIVVITGGTSGIGKILAENYKKNNDKVIILARSIKENSNTEIKCDVGNEDEIKNAFDIIKTLYSKIDILINNAGFGSSGISELIPVEEIKKIIDVNLLGTILCTKYALPLISKGGKIINMSSVMAIFPVPYRAYYASTKSAISAYSFALSMELKDLGILVTAICPGDVKTNFTKNRVKYLETTERYGTKMLDATKKVDAREDTRMSVEKVANKIYNIAEKNKFKPMYIIGGKYKFLYFLYKVFPLSAIFWGIEKFTK